MIESGIFKNLLFIDIETASLTKTFEELPERLQTAWEHKASYINKEELSIEDIYFQKAGIYSEFGKIIAISVGVVYLDKGILKTRIKSLSNDNEKDLLNEFLIIISKYNQENLILCSHNGKEFDFPYITRRLLINQISLPNSLKLSGKKPWEINHIDTLEMWKFGDRKSYTSLDLLCAVLNIESSKSNMNGSEVNQEYYIGNNLEGISHYCSEDVLNVIQIYLVLNDLPVIDKNFIFYL